MIKNQVQGQTSKLGLVPSKFQCLSPLDRHINMGPWIQLTYLKHISTRYKFIRPTVLNFSTVGKSCSLNVGIARFYLLNLCRAY